MEKVLPPSHSTDATGRTVKLLLGNVVLKEAAFQAGVGAKLHAAANAGLPNGLAQVAERADHLPHLRPV